MREPLGGSRPSRARPYDGAIERAAVAAARDTDWGVGAMAWTLIFGVVAVGLIAWGWMSDRAHH